MRGALHGPVQMQEAAFSEPVGAQRRSSSQNCKSCIDCICIALVQGDFGLPPAAGTLPLQPAACRLHDNYRSLLEELVMNGPQVDSKDGGTERAI